MQIDPKAVKWDDEPIDPAKVKWDDKPAAPVAPKPGPYSLESLGNRYLNLENVKRFAIQSPPGAMLRGVKDIIDTGAEQLARLGGADERARVQAMNEAGRREFDAAAEGQVMPQVARVGGQLALTVPAVTALGGAAGAAGLPRLGGAIASGGFRTGAAPAGALAKAGDVGVRVAGGGIAGGVSAGMVNPEDAGAGTGIGAALPLVASTFGPMGQAVGSMLRGREARSGKALAQALSLTPEDARIAAQSLRAADELVPGSRPSVAQVLQTPQAGVLERVVSESRGGQALQELREAQNAARLAALEGVAPTAATGFRQARQDLGEAVGQFATNARAKAKQATSAAYQAVPQDEAALYLPKLNDVAAPYFGPGVVGNRASVDAILAEAQKVGTVFSPGIKAVTSGGPAPRSLAQAVRRAGGISASADEVFRGEVKSIGQELPNMVRNNGGQSLARMAERMHQSGYIEDDSINTLIDALRREARGAKQYSAAADSPERMWQAARDASMGAPPGDEFLPTKVSLGTFENLRKSIGSAQRAAAQDPNRAAEAAALAKMKAAMDDRINQVVAGDGAIDEVLPIAWADALSEARRLKLKEVERFMTGPQAQIFRKGADGQPVLKGDEIIAKFWGNRPGVADDVRSFRRLIDDNPQLLGQFRSMVTSEGASTATAGGALGDRFVRWFESMRPGLAETFDKKELGMLTRIAEDIKRAQGAVNAGRPAVGSDTYQKAQNALSIGLLDNPVVSAVAGRIPYAGGAVDWVKNTAGTARARQLAELLSDPNAAANALMASQSNAKMVNALMNPDLQRAVYRAAPLTVTGR